MSSEPRNESRVPIEEGLFVVPSSSSEEPYLIGSKCGACGEVFFPKRRFCRRCSSREMEQVALSRIGKLYTFTVVRQAPPGSSMKVPYVVGIVELPEGERVSGLLSDCDPDNSDGLKIGDDMELIIDVVSKDETSGNELLGWKFQPIRKRQ